MTAEAFHVRRVVVGHDKNGVPSVLSDGTPPQTIDSPTGFGVSELLWSAGPLNSATDGGDPPREGVGAFPANGGLAARLIRFPATNEWVRVAGDDPQRPGMHRSETLDLMVVVSGQIVLGVEDGAEEVVGPGDAVVQRGTMHRWRVPGDVPCTYLSVLLAPSEGAPVASPPLPRLTAGAGPRLLVTGPGPRGSIIEIAGTGAPDEHGRRPWWATGGPLRSVDQGGVAGAVAPGEDAGISGAISFAVVDLALAGSAGYCTTSGGIDLVLVQSGTVTVAALPGDQANVQPFSLDSGSVLLSRGVQLRLTSQAADLAVASFAPMRA